jgi:hypothetical protein
LQWILSNSVTGSNISSKDHTGSRRWWAGNRLCIPPSVYSDLRLLHQSLQEPGAAVSWSRPIGLLIDRTPTVTLLSDASYGERGQSPRSPGIDNTVLPSLDGLSFSCLPSLPRRKET